ncbi:DUF418 domain-containing protein [Alkalihalobacillus trypoxylicola]|uniref:DUF418 domain-containing protein n=1 Tax=Alkalihalobacillus trypoxylicola TaxID=519424 RepID=UPI000B28155C
MSNSINSSRIEGLDFARALAMFGMLVMNFMVVTGAQGNGAPLLVWFTNLFEGRAAATFVLLAGIGISLMTKRARLSSEKTVIRNTRVSLFKRSIFLFILGMLLYAVGWDGDILHYYGVYMTIAALLILASPKIITLFIIVFASLAQLYQVTFNYMSGWSPTKPFLEYLDFWTLTGFLRNLFLNGYHPILPWICFLLIGMLIGRLNLTDIGIRKTLFIFSSVTLIMTELLSKILVVSLDSILDVESAKFLFETGPIPPNIFYLVSNTASAILIILLCIYLDEKFPTNWLIRSLIYTGQLTLTHYVSHVLIGIGILLLSNKVILFNGFVEQPLSFTFSYACLFFIASIIFSVLWRLKFKRGPIELLMRKYS